MTDIVERLRNDQGIGISLTLCREAADEIERLRKALKLAERLWAQNAALRQPHPPGCICPPTSEQTCQNAICPRKPMKLVAT